MTSIETRRTLGEPRLTQRSPREGLDLNGDAPVVSSPLVQLKGQGEAVMAKKPVAQECNSYSVD